MKELLSMATDQLTNVAREVERLTKQKEQVELEIERLQKYIEEGAATVEKYRAELTQQQSVEQSAPSSSFNLS